MLLWEEFLVLFPTHFDSPCDLDIASFTLSECLEET